MGFLYGDFQIWWDSFFYTLCIRKKLDFVESLGGNGTNVKRGEPYK